MQLSESKSLLAKLMATENLIVEHRKVPTASFDVKNRILTIPILSKELSSHMYDLFTGHEVGHALYTPLDGMLKAKEQKINMGVLNVVEDSRIERKIKYKYPGLKHPFVKAYAEMIENDFFETAGKDLNEYNLIDRINLHCKVGASLAIKFTDEERELLNAVESTETYEEVVEVTKRIIEFMKTTEEPNVTKQILVHFGFEDDDESDGQSEDGRSENSKNEEDGDSDNKEKSESDDTDEEGMILTDPESVSSKPKKPEMSDEMKKLMDKMVQQALDELVNSQTNEAMHRNEHKLYDKNGTEYGYVNIPKVNTNFILDYKELYDKYKEENYEVNTKSYLKYRRESEKVVSYLVKEFELRKNADQMKRARSSKTGELNMNKIFSYKFNDDIFKKTTIVPGGKSHGLVMFLDWSGSMVDHISNTIKQLTNLTIFCKKVNIPFEVYAFIESPSREKQFRQVAKQGDLLLSKFGLANILSSRMSSSEMTYACGALFSMAGIGRRHTSQPYWLSMSGTPLNETIIAAMEIVPEFQKKYNLQNVNTVFLTDGEGSRLANKLIGNSVDECEYLFQQRNMSHVVLRDPQNKQQEIWELNRGSFNQTKALIKLLKLRTNSNVIGFYVANTREFNRKVVDFYPQHKDNYMLYDKIRESFRKNKFLVVEDSGFDEYYVLRSNGLDTEDIGKFDTVASPTTRGLVSAFSKYTANKVNNRVILNRFINLIT